MRRGSQLCCRDMWKIVIRLDENNWKSKMNFQYILLKFHNHFAKLSPGAPFTNMV